MPSPPVPGRRRSRLSMPIGYGNAESLTSPSYRVPVWIARVHHRQRLLQEESIRTGGGPVTHAGRYRSAGAGIGAGSRYGERRLPELQDCPCRSEDQQLRQPGGRRQLRQDDRWRARRFPIATVAGDFRPPTSFTSLTYMVQATSRLRRAPATAAMARSSRQRLAGRGRGRRNQPHTRSGAGFTESAWSGAGSGCGLPHAQPSWQVGVTDACAGRMEADISAVADPKTGVAVYGPANRESLQLAGIRRNQCIGSAGRSAVRGEERLRSTPPLLVYAHTSSLHDVTAGSNGRLVPGELLLPCGSGLRWPYRARHAERYSVRSATKLDV